jgi:DNA-binding MarR family transcriptional regulator
VQTSLGGVDFIERRPGERTWRVIFKWLTAEERKIVRYITQDHDVEKSLILIFDPDATDWIETDILGRRRQLSALTWAGIGLDTTYASGFHIKEKTRQSGAS